MASFTVWTLIRPHREGGFLVSVSAIALRSDDIRSASGDYVSDRRATLDDARTAGARLAGHLIAAIEGRGDYVVSRDTTIDVSDLQPRD
jgi:hypothetical protein